MGMCIMRVVIRIALAAGFLGTITVGTSAPVPAQYYPPPRDYDVPREYEARRDYDAPRDYDGPRDYYAPRRDDDASLDDYDPDYDAPPPGFGHHYGDQTRNGCPPGWTVQGGNCAPYQGPVGGGWRTWNSCPPDYTIQGGVCKPYIGPR